MKMIQSIYETQWGNLGYAFADIDFDNNIHLKELTILSAKNDVKNYVKEKVDCPINYKGLKEYLRQFNVKFLYRTIDITNFTGRIQRYLNKRNLSVEPEMETLINRELTSIIKYHQESPLIGAILLILDASKQEKRKI